jgi:hypothetical protein
MKINRLMQAVFVAGSACVVVPAFAGTTPSLTSSMAVSSLPSLPQCGGDEDDDDGDEDGDDDDGGETRLCGGDSDDDDDGDEDGDDDDGGETRAPTR